MIARRKIAPASQGLTTAQTREIQRARDQEAAHAEMMLEAMRALGFEAVCQTFAGHVMGRPDATAEQKHRAFQDMERIAYIETRNE